MNFIQIKLVDHTGEMWARAFDKEAEMLMNSTAQDLSELKERDFDAYTKMFDATAFKSYLFELRFDNIKVRQLSFILSMLQ